MKDQILAHLDNAGQLEKIYRTNKALFKREFGVLYPQIKGNALADFWYERLNFESDGISWGTGKEFALVVMASLIAGTIAKLPAMLTMDEEFFYSRNVGFIVFPFLMAYFAWKNKLSPGKMAFLAAASMAGLIFINALPDNPQSDTLVLSSIHLVLFLWSLLGFAFVGQIQNNDEKRLGFLKYNGDLLVMTALMLISGGILSAITNGLFSVIGFNIEEFYFRNIVVVGLPAVPIAGTYLIRSNPNLVGKVSPVIARIFSPVALIMLVIYLVAMFFSEKDPYTDRTFLMIFNALLVGVMALIVFSVTENQTPKNRPETGILFLLSVVTIIVNGIVLSAILFRISEWGITPNRAAVLGGNILMLTHLLLVATQLFRVFYRKTDLEPVRKTIAFYLPVYSLWTIIVTFLFPLIFGFR